MSRVLLVLGFCVVVIIYFICYFSSSLKDGTLGGDTFKIFGVADTENIIVL